MVNVGIARVATCKSAALRTPQARPDFSIDRDIIGVTARGSATIAESPDAGAGVGPVRDLETRRCRLDGAPAPRGKLKRRAFPSVYFVGEGCRRGTFLYQAFLTSPGKAAPSTRRGLRIVQPRPVPERTSVERPFPAPRCRGPRANGGVRILPLRVAPSAPQLLATPAEKGKGKGEGETQGMSDTGYS